MSLPPSVPSLSSFLLCDALSVSPDGRVVTISKAKLLQHEANIREYYRRQAEQKERDFLQINPFLLLYYQQARPSNVEGRYFNLILAAFIHSQRQYLTVDGKRATTAENKGITDCFNGRSLRPYFTTWNDQTFKRNFEQFKKHPAKYIERIPDFYPLHPVRREFVKRMHVYRLTPTAHRLIKDYQREVIKNYDSTIEKLTAEAWILHAFKELPPDMRNLNKERKSMLKRGVLKK